MGKDRLVSPENRVSSPEFVVPFGNEIAIVRASGSRLKADFQRECQLRGIGDKAIQRVSDRLSFIALLNDKPTLADPAGIEVQRKASDNGEIDYQFRCCFDFTFISRICQRLTKGSTTEATQAAMRQFPSFLWEHEREHLIEMAEELERTGSIDFSFRKEAGAKRLTLLRYSSLAALLLLAAASTSVDGSRQDVCLGTIAIFWSFYLGTTIPSLLKFRRKVIDDHALNNRYNFQGQSYFEISFEPNQPDLVLPPALC